MIKHTVTYKKGSKSYIDEFRISKLDMFAMLILGAIILYAIQRRLNGETTLAEAILDEAGDIRQRLTSSFAFFGPGGEGGEMSKGQLAAGILGGLPGAAASRPFLDWAHGTEEELRKVFGV